jgi:prepilin peptidase CpaA
MQLSFPPLAIRILLLILAGTAAAFDLKTRRIPNWLTVAGAAAGLLVNAWLFGWAGLWDAAAGLGLALLVYVPLVWLRGMGAGDAKLMAAIGALAGPANWLAVFALSGLLGGVMGLALALWKRRLRNTLASTAELAGELARLRKPHERKPEWDVHQTAGLRLPYGLVIASGVAAFLLLSRVWPVRYNP